MGSSWRIGTVEELHDETPSARTLVLRVAGWPGHDAGQHVDVRLTAPDGYTAVRAYSVASAPDGDRVELTVDRVPDGEVSPYLVQAVSVGDQLEVRGPLGGWFVWRPSQPEPVQLVAGGSGIVPLMAILRTHAAVGGRAGGAAPIRLLYSVRDPGSTFYRDELARLGRQPSVQRGDVPRVSYVYTRSAPPGWPCRIGRLDRVTLAESTWVPGQAPTCYVCGPTGFVESTADLLIEAGHDPARIKTERFGPSGGTR